MESTHDGQKNHKRPARGSARLPAGIPAGQVTDQLVGMPDIYRILLEAGGGQLPEHTLDGYDVMPFFTGETDTAPRREYAYFQGGQLEALRVGKWKLRVVREKPELFNLQGDPGEQFNRAEDKPEIVERLRARMEEVAKETGWDIFKTKKDST